MRNAFLAATLAGLLAAGAADAASTTATFNVTATVLTTCSATAAAMAFPNYTPSLGAVTASSAISVKCTKNTPYTVALNAGGNAGDLYTQRVMLSGANQLQYNLYTTVALATVFGDGTGATSTMPGTGAGMTTANTTTVFGQVPDGVGNQAVVPGVYSDVITVTVSY
jgi:spore coat protein U-like protein